MFEESYTQDPGFTKFRNFPERVSGIQDKKFD
jgi:hypothetical protein